MRRCGTLPVMAETLGGYRLGELVRQDALSQTFVAHAQGICCGGFMSGHLTLRRFRKEALSGHPGLEPALIAWGRAVAKLVHPNIAQVNLLSREDGCLVLGVDDVLGLDLATVLRLLAVRGEHLPGGLAVAIVDGVLGALTCAHNHRSCDGQAAACFHLALSPQQVRLGWRGQIQVEGFHVNRALMAVLATQVADPTVPLPDLPAGLSDATVDVCAAALLARGLLAPGFGQVFDGVFAPPLAVPPHRTDMAELHQSFRRVLTREKIEMAPDTACALLVRELADATTAFSHIVAHP